MKKQLFILCLCFITCLCLASCGNDNSKANTALTSVASEELIPIDTTNWTTYHDKSQSFSVKFSNQWEQQETLAEQSIFLDNASLQAAVKFQRYNKDILALQNVTDLDSFVKLHHQASIGALLSIAKDLTDVPKENLSAEITHAQTFSYTIEDKEKEENKSDDAEEATAEADNTIKCYLAYLETPVAYYSCLISAPTSAYDNYIHIWSTITSSLLEYEESAAEVENKTELTETENTINEEEVVEEEKELTTEEDEPQK